MEQFESSQIPRMRTDCTGWIRSEQMTTGLEESSAARRPEEPHHLSFAGVKLETTAEHPGENTVRNPDRKAFSLVCLAVTVDLRIISIHVALESMCPNDALKSSAVYIVKRSGPRTEPWGTPPVIEVEDDASSP